MGVYTTDAKMAYRRALGFYTLTALPGAAVVVLFNVYFLIYATDVLFIAPAVIGTIIAVSRVYDGVTDIAFAAWSDRVESKHGRRRPFILAGGLLAIAYGAMWLPPENFGAAATAIWVGFMLILWETAWTLRTTGLYALGIELGQTPERRSWYQTVMMVVSLPIAVGAHLLVQHLVDSPDARAAGAPWFVGLGVVVALITAVLGPFLRELPVQGQTVERSVWRMLKEVLGVGYHRQLIAVSFAESFAFSSLVFSIAYVLTYVLDRPEMMAMIAVPYLVVSQLSKIGWLKMIPRWGMKRIWMHGLRIWLAIFLAMPLILVFGFPLYFALGLLAGIAGGAAAVNFAMLGDIADYDARHSGRQRQAIYSAIYSLIAKLGGALTAFVLGWLLQFAGFVPNEEQGSIVIAVIIASSSLLPFIGVFIGLRILAGYRFYEAEGISDGKRDFKEEAVLGGTVANPA